MKNKQYGDGVLKELQEVVYKPNCENEWEPSRFLDLVNFENIKDLNLYTNCFNEALRIQPPVYLSSFAVVHQDLTAGDLKL